MTDAKANGMSKKQKAVLKSLCLFSQGIRTALYYVKLLGPYAMRLPNWPKDCALVYCKKSGRLIWIDDVDAGDAELRGKEIVSEEWEIWRIK